MQMQKKKRIALAALAAVGLLTLSGCDLFQPAAPKLEPEDLSVIRDTTFPKGVKICGVDMEGKTKEQAQAILSRQEAELKPFTITLSLDDQVFTYTQDDFTIDANTDKAVADAYTYLFESEPMEYYAKKFLLSKEEHNFGTAATLNQESLKQTMEELADTLNRDPVEPQVVSFQGKTFNYSDGKDGFKVKTKELIAAVADELKKSDTVALEIPVEVLKPEHSKEDFDGKVDVLSTYSTVSTNTADGNHNMALALEYVNGTTINPGETFSFNGTVGDSTNDSRGFRQAGVIANGKSSMDYGGGICQASTTIYGAALRADMTIIERHNHMWPSTYVEIGQDAAIDYGIQDFCFRNDTDKPVYIQAGMDGVTLSVTFLGYASKDWDEITVSSWETGTTAQPKDEYVKDSDLEKDEIETYRPGRAGKTAAAQRTYYKNGAVVKTEDLFSSSYPALSTIYHYGPGTKIDD